MTTLTTPTIKNEHRTLYAFHELKKPAVVLDLLSVIVLVFPIVPLGLLAIFVAVQIPASSNAGIMPTAWFLGGPAGMAGLILATFKKRNIITVILLIYGVATYSPLLFPFYAVITSKNLFHIFYTFYFSIPPIVAVIHIGISIRSIWVIWKATP